jgi:RpiR family glv operon transcriptional regulator
LTFQSEEIHTIGYGFLYYSTLHFHIVNEFLTLKYMEHQLKKQEAITENNEEKH